MASVVSAEEFSLNQRVHDHQLEVYRELDSGEIELTLTRTMVDGLWRHTGQSMLSWPCRPRRKVSQDLAMHLLHLCGRNRISSSGDDEQSVRNQIAIGPPDAARLM